MDNILLVIRKTGQIIKKHQCRSTFEAETICQLDIGIDVFEYLRQKKFMFVDINHFRAVF